MDLRHLSDADASTIESPALDGFRKTAKLPVSGGLWGEVGSRVGAANLQASSGLSLLDGTDGNI